LSKILIINNTPYNYPTAGDEPGWGSDATGWASAVTDVLSDILGPDDILETAFNVANNQTSFTDVTGLAFNSASVRSAEISYSIFRVSTANPSGHTETGIIQLTYDNGFSINQGNTLGTSGVIFDVTNTGQVRYKSSDINSIGYVGTLKFRAKTLSQ
jgi:hypothetical protein